MKNNKPKIKDKNKEKPLMMEKQKKVKSLIKINLINTKKWYKKALRSLGMISLSHSLLFNRYKSQQNKKKAKNK